MAESNKYLDYEGLVKFVELIQANFPTKEITAEALDTVNQCLTELVEKYNEHTHSLENIELNVSYSEGKLSINSSHNHTVQTISSDHLQTPPPALPESLKPNGGGGSTIDYSKEYFTIVALEDGLTVQLSQTLEYRIDDGDWISLTKNTATPSINNGQKISFKITNPNSTTYESIGTFTVNKAFNAEGNIMSLLYGDDFDGQIDLSRKYFVFAGLFNACTTLQSVENLILPATTLADYCYQSMFDGCTGLITAPELPATTLAVSCYSNMFLGCTNLTTAPELLTTTLAEECYMQMFYGCSKLNYIKMLATNIGTSLCLYEWVYGVASNGTFIKHPNMTSLPTGTSGIPSGWTVQDA